MYLPASNSEASALRTSFWSNCNDISPLSRCPPPNSCAGHRKLSWTVSLISRSAPSTVLCTVTVTDPFTRPLPSWAGTSSRRVNESSTPSGSALRLQTQESASTVHVPAVSYGVPRTIPAVQSFSPSAALRVSLRASAAVLGTRAGSGVNSYALGSAPGSLVSPGFFGSGVPDGSTDSPACRTEFDGFGSSPVFAPELPQPASRTPAAATATTRAALRLCFVIIGPPSSPLPRAPPETSGRRVRGDSRSPARRVDGNPVLIPLPELLSHREGLASGAGE
ncbi:protein of unknown function [Streptomyces sp. KY70]|nr:protein of unknown function [Streptomyces sp. KY70]